MEEKQLFNETSFKKNKRNGYIYGKVNDYFFVLEKGSQIGLYRLKINIKDKDVLEEITDELRGRHPSFSFACVRQNIADGELSLDVNILRFNEAKDLDRLLEDLTSSLKDRACIQVSSLDGKTTDLGIYQVGRSAKIISDEGFADESKVNKKVSRGQQENRVLGYLGALIALALATVIRVFSFRYIPINFIGIMALVSVTLAYKGYEFKGGALRKADIYILFVLALFTAPLSWVFFNLTNPFFANGGFSAFWFLLQAWFVSALADPASILIELAVAYLFTRTLVMRYLNVAPDSPVNKYQYRKLM